MPKCSFCNKKINKNNKEVRRTTSSFILNGKKCIACYECKNNGNILTKQINKNYKAQITYCIGGLLFIGINSKNRLNKKKKTIKNNLLFLNHA